MKESTGTKGLNRYTFKFYICNGAALGSAAM